MATKSVIEIDVLDEKFKAFQQAFEKYQKAVKGMPADWQKVNDTLNNIDASQKKMNKSLSDNSKALRDAAYQTGVIAKNMASSAISIAKWVALGAIGSGFGLGGIAASANDYRRKAQGLGISTGDLRGANVTLSRYINPESTLGNIADIKSDLARQQILGRLGGGANQSPATVGNQMYNQQQSSYSDQQQQTQQSWNNIFGAVGAVTGASLGMPGGGGSMFSGISAMFDSLFGNNYGNLAQQNSSQMGNPNSTVQNYPGV